MLCHELWDSRSREWTSQDAAIVSPRRATTLHRGNASIIFPSTIIRLYGAAAPAALRGNQTTLLPARFEPSSGSSIAAARRLRCVSAAATVSRRVSTHRRCGKTCLTFSYVRYGDEIHACSTICYEVSSLMPPRKSFVAHLQSSVAGLRERNSIFLWFCLQNVKAPSESNSFSDIIWLLVHYFCI